MQTTTRQGAALTVHLEAIHRVPAGHPEPIVSFRYVGGIECCCFWLSAFLQRPSDQPFYVSPSEVLAPDAVAACQRYCAALMAEVRS